MARRMSASQIRNKIRQAQRKQQQAINRYNQSVRKNNRERKRAIDKYNREVRAHNARVRVNRQRIKRELSRLSSQPVTKSRYVVYRKSVRSMHASYTQLENRATALDIGGEYNKILDLSERETANSLEVANQLLGSMPDGEIADHKTENVELLDRLRSISDDLDDRWNGAVYALNPNNPDAARHFCTSAREILTHILEIKAPDPAVLARTPDCEVTDQGKPTRRSKIKFLLHMNAMEDIALEDFVEEDLDNIIHLFRIFNDATHGSAGKFSLGQLASIKKRVEDGIYYLIEIIGNV